VVQAWSNLTVISDGWEDTVYGGATFDEASRIGGWLVNQENLWCGKIRRARIAKAKEIKL
jgi:hypothetical protein